MQLKLAIRFCDNDYVNTLLPFLKYLALSFQDFDLNDFNQNSYSSKQKLFALILECLPTFYLLNQVAKPSIMHKRYHDFLIYMKEELKWHNFYLGDEVDVLLEDSKLIGNHEIYCIYNNVLQIV